MKAPERKILVPLDFEEQSLNALRYSFELAELFKCDLILVYVIEGISVFGKLRSPEEYLNKVVAEAREKFDELEQLAKSLSDKPSVKVSYRIKQGKPYDKIIETAYENDVFLIVMGKNGNLSLRKNRTIMGSNTLNVIRESQRPVFTISSNVINPANISNILLPLDFTGQTKKQVQNAIDFGKLFDAQITVVSILTGDNRILQLRKQVQLSQVKKAIRKHGIVCKASLIHSKGKMIADWVVEHSKRIEADLIIIMTQQKTKVVEFYVGSTAQKIISHSSVPVLSIFPASPQRAALIAPMVDPFGVMG